MKDILKSLKGNLIVSAQALPEEPLYLEERSIMDLMAKAAVMAGAKGIRCNSVRDVIAIKKVVNCPVIGLIKKTIRRISTTYYSWDARNR